MKYNKIVLIFPTLSLLSENYIKLKEDALFSEYQIHTLSDFGQVGIKNIWIYTPERFLSMTDKNPNLAFDFIFMDEVYKIDNQYIISNDLSGENERDVAYRIALFNTCLKSKDILLAGPYMKLPEIDSQKSIDNFLRKNRFIQLNYNNIEIVDKKLYPAASGNQVNVDDGEITLISKDKQARLLEILTNTQENSLIYCSGRAHAEEIAKVIIASRKESQYNVLERFQNDVDKAYYINFYKHLVAKFGEDWVVAHGIRYGVGVHHGFVPKYIQKEIMGFFKKGIISAVTSTTTITEGINTNAKNMIIMSAKKGKKELKKFDAQNIVGRAGRFFQHFVGKVYAVETSFLDLLNSDGLFLEHKNYDKTAPKTEIDYEITSNEYLNEAENQKKQLLLEQVRQRGIPFDIIFQFKSVPLSDKIKVYDAINQYNDFQFSMITILIERLVYESIDWKAFDLIVETLKPIVQNISLLNMINYRTKDKTTNLPKKDASTGLTVKLHYYLEDGYSGFLNYILQNQEIRNLDKAIRETSELVYNLFRYQLTKYLGVFDILYRYVYSQKHNISFDDVIGISKLLQKLEYGAFSAEGKIVSDFGAPLQ